MNPQQKLASGAGQEEPLFQSQLAKFWDDWPPDDRYLLYSQIAPKTLSDLWILRLPVSASPFHTALASRWARAVLPVVRWKADGSGGENRGHVPGGPRVLFDTRGATQFAAAGRKLLVPIPEERASNDPAPTFSSTGPRS